MFDFEKRKLKSAKVVEDTIAKHGDCGILAPALPAQEAMNILIDHLLGKDWYVVYPCNGEQVNTEAVCTIIENYRPKRWAR